MRAINRTAVTLVGREPYRKWARSRDADFARNTLTVQPTMTHGACVLLPEFDLEEDLLEWVEENYAWLFEVQLAAWTEDESAWPNTRTLKMFREWFRVESHNTVVDASDEDIEGEEL
jgi:hypothetical protein